MSKQAEAMEKALARLQARTDTADLNAIAALNKAQPQQEQQEPVAWLIDNDYTTVFRDIAEAHRNKGANVEPLYIKEQL